MADGEEKEQETTQLPPPTTATSNEGEGEEMASVWQFSPSPMACPSSRELHLPEGALPAREKDFTKIYASPDMSGKNFIRAAGGIGGEEGEGGTMKGGVDQNLLGAEELHVLDGEERIVGKYTVCIEESSFGSGDNACTCYEVFTDIHMRISDNLQMGIHSRGKVNGYLETLVYHEQQYMTLDSKIQRKIITIGKEEKKDGDGKAGGANGGYQIYVQLANGSSTLSRYTNEKMVGFISDGADKLLHRMLGCSLFFPNPAILNEAETMTLTGLDEIGVVVFNTYQAKTGIVDEASNARVIISRQMYTPEEVLAKLLSEQAVETNENSVMKGVDSNVPAQRNVQWQTILSVPAESDQARSSSISSTSTPTRILKLWQRKQIGSPISMSLYLESVSAQAEIPSVQPSPESLPDGICLSSSASCFLHEYSSDAVDSSLLGTDHMALICRSGARVGNFSVDISKGSYKGINCYVVKANADCEYSSSSKLGTHIESFVSPDFIVLFEKEVALVQVGDQTQRSVMMTWHDSAKSSYVHVYTDAEYNTKMWSIDCKQNPGYISEGSAFVIQKVIIQEKKFYNTLNDTAEVIEQEPLVFIGLTEKKEYAQMLFSGCEAPTDLSGFFPMDITGTEIEKTFNSRDASGVYGLKRKIEIFNVHLDGEQCVSSSKSSEWLNLYNSKAEYISRYQHSSPLLAMQCSVEMELERLGLQSEECIRAPQAATEGEGEEFTKGSKQQLLDELGMDDEGLAKIAAEKIKDDYQEDEYCSEPWTDDMELVANYIANKDQLKAESMGYIDKHPELYSIISDFLQHTLHNKPEDVYEFASKHFSQFSQV
eukprot:Nk52_evm14s303 gene=Nk52_evmTU14s303